MECIILPGVHVFILHVSSKPKWLEISLQNERRMEKEYQKNMLSYIVTFTSQTRNFQIKQSIHFKATVIQL